MQFKTATKIIIDKRKLDTLIRLGCPDKEILSIIKTGKFSKTGDLLIDENLETLIDVKEFNNWGGKRDGAGRPLKNNKNNQVENHLENQLEIQDGNQDYIQVVDKDKDIHNINNNKYIYKGKIIKLNKRDFDKWKEKYNLLDLEYELDQIDLALQTEKHQDKQKDWFFVVQGWLNKKQKEKKDAQKKSEYTDDDFMRSIYEGRR